MATYIKKDFASPNGPILLLSAKGSTTASIAVADGVKDFSGNRNHGKGNNGVTVEKYGCCDCFGFPNNNSYIYLSDKKDTIFTQTSAYTFSVTFVITSKPTRANGILVMWSYSSPQIQIWLTSDYKLRITADNNFTEYNSSLSIEVNTIYTITVSANYTTGHREVWANGSLCNIMDKAGKELTINIGHLILGNHSTTTGYNLPGYIIDARIYPRALSSAEVKYLYNGFQPNIIVGQTIPSGSILDLSARGLTTAGIAQANGVVDRSGNGNNGQAYNGVAVVNDDEMGSCFSFSTTNNIHIECPLVNTSINTDSFTFSFKYKRTGIITTGNQLLFSAANSSNVAKFSLYCLTRTNYTNDNANVLTVNMYTNNSNALEFNLETLGKKTLDVHVYALTYNHTIDELKIYLDGILLATQSFSHQDNFEMTKFLIGYVSSNVYHPVGLMTDIRAYNRCLNASEIQQLADASLKKITNIKSGSSDVRQIFSNGEMIYAKTNDYSLNL